MSRKNLSHTRLIPVLLHKGYFPYEWSRGPRRRLLYRDVAPAAGPRDRRCAGCLPDRVQRSPWRHSASDYFVACFVKAEFVFFAMVFPDEHNVPDDRALSWREMGAKRRRALRPSHTQTPHPWPRTLPGARCAVHRYGGRQPPPLHAMMAAKVDHEDPERARRT